MVLEHWEAVLGGLESDPATLADTLDWVAKRELMLAYQNRHSCGVGRSPGGRTGLQYHDLRPDKSVFRRLGLRTLVDAAEVAAAVTEPPRGRPGPGSVASAWPAGPTPWSPPTGIPSYSTSARTRSGASL